MMVAVNGNRPLDPTTIVNRVVVASFERYDKAQRAVDFLSDNHFAVEHIAIIGSDLRLVEAVLGRLTKARATLAGAGTGAWFGLFVGLLLALFSARSGTSTLGLVLAGLAYGAVFGAVFGFVAHATSGGRRDFTSRNQLVAARYDVVCDPEHADDAKNLLIKLAWREG